LAGIRPTPAGELTALPRSLAEFRGRGGEEKDLGRWSGTGKGRDMGEFYNCIVVRKGVGRGRGMWKGKGRRDGVEEGRVEGWGWAGEGTISGKEWTRCDEDIF